MDGHRNEATSVIVTQLPKEVYRRNINEHFSEVGTVVKSHLVRDNGNYVRCWVFLVEYCSSKTLHVTAVSSFFYYVWDVVRILTEKDIVAVYFTSQNYNYRYISFSSLKITIDYNLKKIQDAYKT